MIRVLKGVLGIKTVPTFFIENIPFGTPSYILSDNVIKSGGISRVREIPPFSIMLAGWNKNILPNE